MLLTDNGFGSRGNSADAMLMVHIASADWASGRLIVARTIFMADPDRVMPFPITTEFTVTRYLTGADLDPEGIQPVGDDYWIGDEFGPYLIRVDAAGRVVEFHETVIDGLSIQSPDHHRLELQADPSASAPPSNLRRSRGFEGLASAADGTTLLPMLEGRVFDPETGTFETRSGLPAVRILELVIERDWLEGDARLDMAEPALFKRVYLIDLDRTDEAGVAEKLGFIDLLAIADPDGLSLQGTIDAVFSFPFVTIENVDRVDDRHINVGNDNNYPLSIGRAPGRADDNELILLEVEDLLALR